MSEVSLGAFLSGGVDSAAVVTAMGEAVRADRSMPSRSAWMRPGMDERAHARMTAGALGNIRLHEEVARGIDHRTCCQELAWHLDQPFADSSAAPTWMVSEAARRHVTVALSGDGGDENFAGYRRTRFDVLEDQHSGGACRSPSGAISSNRWDVPGRVRPKAAAAPFAPARF